MQFPGTYPDNILGGIAGWFGSIGTTFKAWGDYLEGYLLFEHTIAPVFIWFADAAFHVRDWFVYADWFVQRAWWVAKETVWGGLIGDVIAEKLPVLWEFYTWPWGYVRQLIGRIWGIPADLLTMPWAWFDLLARQRFPGWDALKANPTLYIIDRLTVYYPDLFAFLDDPLRKVRHWLADILEIPWSLRDLPWYWPGEILDRFFYRWRDLAIDPWGYLKGVIYAGTPQLRWVFDDPLEWLWRQTTFLLGMPAEYALQGSRGFLSWMLYLYRGWFYAVADDVKDLGERTIRYFWEGVF